MTDDPVLAYAKAVLAGEIVAGPHVRNACRRHMADLKAGPSRGLKWDLAAAKRALEFFPDVLRLAQKFDGLPFDLHASQKFIIGSLFGWKHGKSKRRFRRAYIEQGKGNGKALAIGTPIATPNGWTTMGAIEVGDTVFDETGAPCRVTAKSDVMTDRKCFSVRFSDGAEIVADAEHLWVTSALRTGLKKGPKAASEPRKGGSGVRTTAEIAATLRMAEGTSKHPQAKWNHRVAVAGALKLPDAVLPVPPYTLGAWLGDGDSDCARMTMAYSDAEIAQAIRAEGISVDEQVKHSDTTARLLLGSNGHAGRSTCLQAKLRRLGLLGNKRIPPIYMRASEAQRLELLRGLLDTDGSALKGGALELTLCSKPLVDDAVELIRSLGLKTQAMESAAVLNGQEVGRRWRIMFFAYADTPVFHLARKRSRLVDAPLTRALSRGRMITGCDVVPSVPVQCISVDSPSRMFLAGQHLVPTHNSPTAAGIGMYMLVADGEQGAEVYAGASQKSQAMVLFRDAVAMWRQSPSLAKRLTPSGGNPIWNLADLKSASFFRPISTDEAHSGPRPSCALLDEIHEHRDGHMIEMMERGFKSREQPLLVMITNSGSDRLSVCWQEHQHAIRCAAGTQDIDADATYVGEVIDDTTFSFVCGLDADDDPLEDPTCWVKANPLLGITMPEEELARAVKQAKAIPGKLNNILRLHFCTWTSSDQAWMSRPTLEAVLHDFDPEMHSGESVFIGLDLSATQDLTAMACVVPTGEDNRGLPTFDAWVEAWTPAGTLAERALRDNAPYEVWARDGWLQTSPGKVINFAFVASRMAEVASLFEVKSLAYDSYGFGRMFEPELDEIGLTLPVVEHPQGGKKKGKTGLWMPGSKLALENAILEGRIRLRRSPVLVSACMAAATENDPYGNFWFSKRKATMRIDALVALAMAFGAASGETVSEPEYQLMFA